MDISTSVDEGVARVQIVGRFDAHETDDVRSVIDDLIATGHCDIVVELDEVLFIDSSGLAELVRGMKRCRERQGDLTLSSPSDPVQVILELTGLVNAFAVIAQTS